MWLGIIGLVLADQYKISWIAPVDRADRTALSLSEIDGYELYYMVNDEWVYLRDKDAALSQKMQINLGPGPYKFALKTIDTEGRLSVMSDSVVSPPGTPGVPVIVCQP
jgi:hypothetical protein